MFSCRLYGLCKYKKQIERDEDIAKELQDGNKSVKCDDNGIELRIVDRWYPSSKLCHCCGSIKKDLQLSDRIYRCDCGYTEDRDFNASLNLRDALTYEIA